VDDYQTLSKRFERLSQIVILREKKLKELESEVLRWYQLGNISEIQKLMLKKEQLRSTNQKLSLFIVKWEKDHRDYLSEDQLHMSV
jgi:hypothetical protein